MSVMEVPVDDGAMRKYLQARFLGAVAVVQHRRMSDSPLKRSMQDIADRYNGDFTIPLPDVAGEPEFPALSASLIADAIDSSATRANDTTPTIVAPPVDPTQSRSRSRAHLRRRAWAACWSKSQLPLRLGRAYRQYFGYGTFGLTVIPNFTSNRATIQTRDPMCMYPEPMGTDEIRAPLDIGHVYGRSPKFLRKQYPEARALIDKFTSSDDDMWDVLEWQDEDWMLIGIMGKRRPEDYQRRQNADGSVTYQLYSDGPLDTAMLLRAYPNRAGMVTSVCPAAVTLDRVISALKRIVPQTDLLNKIAALDFLAAEKGVFPDRYVIGAQNETPRIVGGQWVDGRTGQVNLLEGVQGIGELQTAPGQATQALMSMLERNARVSSGNPSVFQGEASGSIRSGQTVTQLGAFSVDPRIKEAHQIMGYALGIVNESVACIEKGYWPARTQFVFSGWASDNTHVEYVPAEIWDETYESVVTYPMPGMDANNATIALAQANGAKMMSRKTARMRHPMIDDPDVEEQQLMAETLDEAITMSALQQVAQGTFPFTDLVKIKELVSEGKPIEAAVAQVQKEAQERQASQAPPAPEGMAASPEAQAGVNAPGAGAEMMGPEQIAQQGNRAAAFNSILSALKNQSPGAAGAPAGGAPVA